MPNKSAYLDEMEIQAWRLKKPAAGAPAMNGKHCSKVWPNVMLAAWKKAARKPYLV